MGMGSQSHTPAALPPGKIRYAYMRQDGAQGWCGRARKISPPSVFDPRTVQPVAPRGPPVGADCGRTVKCKFIGNEWLLLEAPGGMWGIGGFDSRTLTLTPDRGEQSASRLGRFTTVERPSGTV
jgi:hypothetical protein